MDNKELDNIVKNKITENSENQPKADWEVFSQILKKAKGFEDIVTDKIIEEKVIHYKTNYNENHWQLLKDRLVKEENLRKKIFSSKAIESILVLLLLLIFQNYNNYTLNLNFSTPIKEVVALNTWSKISTGELKGDSKTLNSKINPSHKSKKSYKTLEDLLSYVHSAEAYASPPDNIDFVSSNGTSNEAHYGQDLYGPDERSTDKTSFCQSIPLVNPILNVKSEIDYINKSGIKIALIESNEFLPSTPINSYIPKKFITASFSYGVGIAKSEYDAIYNIKGYSTYSSQYGLGLLYSLKKNKIEVQSGIRYSKKKYEPNKLIETYGNLYKGYREISLDKISYDIVDVPLSIKYFFKETPKTSFFFKAGVNANFSLANRYLVESTYTNSSNNAFAAKLEISDSKDLDQSTKLSQKDFSPGLLQGNDSHSLLSKITDNTFFTVSGEVGVERKISKENALVLGIEYNKYYKIEGIGPNKDKLSALMLNFGFKHSLN